MLDAEDPGRILCRSQEPIMIPQADFEREGFVPNVVFPTGAVDRGETVLVYYGAADTSAAVVEFRKKEILSALVG